MRLYELKAIRLKTGKSQEKVAQELNCPVGTYRNWEQLKYSPRSRELEILADYFGCTTDALLGRTLSKDTAAPHVSRNNLAYVPVYGRIAAGDSIDMCEVIDSYPVPKEIRDTYPHGFLLKVCGTSMDKLIPDCAYAYVNTDDTNILNGQIYAVAVNDEDATIRKIITLNNGIKLIPQSSDPTYKERILDFDTPEMIAHTVGRVVWCTMPFDYLTQSL